jgi:hypothetical protein
MASSGRLKPEEAGEITAKVNTKGRSGKLHKTVTVLSNDPERPEVVLSLKAMVVNSVLPVTSGSPFLVTPGSN